MKQEDETQTEEPTNTEQNQEEAKQKKLPKRKRPIQQIKKRGYLQKKAMKSSTEEDQ